MIGVTLARPWLTFDLGRDMQVLSWAINRPGFVNARRILWREVRNADLSETLDVRDWLTGELVQHDAEDAVVLLTSRDVSTFADATVKVGRCTARCIATVGLSNAERVGHRVTRTHDAWGTINIAVAVNVGLTRAALIEAVSIAAQARTTAIMDIDLGLPTGRATGTGTDCIAVASPHGPGDYAGLHTDVGAALGAAVYRATLAGARDWMTDQPKYREAPDYDRSAKSA